MSRNRPIENINDPEYTIKYKKEADETFNKYFSNSNNDVIFLNGKWGSGKTSFLNVVLDNKKGVKLKFIDLWRITSNQNPTEKILKKVYPFSYWIVKYLSMIAFALLSMVSIYFLKTDNTEWSFPFLVAGFLAGLNQIIGKVNYDDLFLTCLKIRSKNSLFEKKKVIVIDDFDRIESDKQKDLYKIFNLLNNRKKIQFVFLGNYTQIINSETEYLQKIIDRRIELPYAISPSNIWSNYIDHLINVINEKRSVKIQKKEKENIKKLQVMLVSENRVLREKKMFEEYVNEILIETDRYDKVNLDQQLVIVYLYLFHTERYNSLVNNIENILNLKPRFAYNRLENREYDIEKEYLEPKKIKFNKLMGFDKNIEVVNELSELTWEVLLKFEKHLKNDKTVEHAFNEFELHFPHYLINYVPMNLTGYEIRELLNNNIKLEDFINKIKQNGSDVFNFIRRNQENLSNEEKNKLFNFSIDIISQGYDKLSGVSQIVNIGFSIKFHYMADRELINKFEQLTSDKLNLSQRLYVYYKYFYFNIPNLRGIFQQDCNLLLNSKGLNNIMYPQYIISVVFEKIDDIDFKTLNKITEFNEDEFYNILSFYGLFNVSDEILKVKIDNKETKNIIDARVNKLSDKYKEKILIS